MNRRRTSIASLAVALLALVVVVADAPANAQFVRWLEVNPAALDAADAGVHLLRGTRSGRSARWLPLQRSAVAALRFVGLAGERNLTDQILEHQPRLATLDLPILNQSPGWIVLDLQPQTREWLPSRWRAFLAAEDLIGPPLPGWNQPAEQPLHIRGHSSFKVLVHRPGGTRTDAVTKPVGQVLEIVLAAVPELLNGNLLPVRVLFRGQPLASSHLLAANPETGMELVVPISAKGEAVVPLRSPGTWILSATVVGPGDGTVDAEFFSTTATIHRR